MTKEDEKTQKVITDSYDDIPIIDEENQTKGIDFDKQAKLDE